MRLTAEEKSRLHEALTTLGRSLKDEIEAIPEKRLSAESRTGINMDDAFLNMISQMYLSAEHGAPGLVGLLLDSGLVTGTQNCLCGLTCSTPTSENSGCPLFICNPYHQAPIR